MIVVFSSPIVLGLDHASVLSPSTAEEKDNIKAFTSILRSFSLLTSKFMAMPQAKTKSKLTLQQQNDLLGCVKVMARIYKQEAGDRWNTYCRIKKAGIEMTEEQFNLLFDTTHKLVEQKII